MEQRQNQALVPQAPGSGPAPAPQPSCNGTAAARHAPGSDPAAAPLSPGAAPAVLPPAPGNSVPVARSADAAAATFDPVPLRYRVDGWTPARQRAFIEQLAETLSVEAAAALVGMSAQSARELRRRAGAEGFAAA